MQNIDYTKFFQDKETVDRICAEVEALTLEQLEYNYQMDIKYGFMNTPSDRVKGLFVRRALGKAYPLDYKFFVKGN